MKNTILGLVLICSLGVSYAQQLDRSQCVNSTEDLVTISLTANPTTGYQWTIKSMDSDLLRLKSSVFLRDRTASIGAGGQRVFTFDKLKSDYQGKSAISFSYARSWEKQQGSTMTVELDFSPKCGVTNNVTS